MLPFLKKHFYVLIPVLLSIFVVLSPIKQPAAVQASHGYALDCSASEEQWGSCDGSYVGDYGNDANGNQLCQTLATDATLYHGVSGPAATATCTDLGFNGGSRDPNYCCSYTETAPTPTPTLAPAALGY